MNSRDPATFYLHRARTQVLSALGTPSRTVSSDSIFRGEREIGIEHHGALYRLKVTRQGKLILNK